MPKISNLPAASVVNLTDILPEVSPASGGTTKKATFQQVLTAFVGSGAFVPTSLGAAEIFVGNASNVATAMLMSGDAVFSNTGVLTLAGTGVTPGAYTVNGNALFTVDSKGRITSATNAVVAGTDITGAALTEVNDTNVTLTLGGSASTSLLRAASITAGWAGQLSMVRGGTGANLTASDGGVVVSNTTSLQILPTSGGLNNILLTSTSGSPHWSLSSFPDSVAVGNMLYCNSTNIWSLLAPVSNSVLTSNGSGIPTWSTALPVSQGGTGTSTAFTTGSVIFAGASGVYSQDNTNLFWDDTNARLGLATNSSLTTSLNVNGKISLFDGGTRSFNTGITTEINGAFIDIGTNDGSSNIFGGSYSSGSQGGYFRVGASGTALHSWFVRRAGLSGFPTLAAYITADANFGLSSGALATTAINGFPYIPTCNGTPTGSPTSLNGLAPIVWDSLNSQLYVYGSAWKKTITSGEALTKTDDANVTITLGGSPSTSLVNAASLTMGWSGQLSLSRGGTNASLTASDGGVVYSSASALQILPTSGGLNNILLTSISGAPHWTLSSFPDSCAVGNMLICNTTNIWSVLPGVANSVMTSNASGVAQWSTTLPVAQGGTGTGTAFTTGSVVFAGASGVYSQDNTNLFWDDSNNYLGINTNSSLTTALNINGVLSMFDGGSRVLNAGIQTELNGRIINIGLNDGTANKFGGSYTVSSGGGFFRVDSRTSGIFQWYAREANVAGGGTQIATLTNDPIFSIRGNSNPGSIEILGGPVAGDGSNLKIYGGGTTGATVSINLSTYDPTTNDPSAQIKCTEVSGFGNDIFFSNKVRGAITNSLKTRFCITANGDVVAGDLATVIPTNSSSGFLYLTYMAGSPTNTPNNYVGSKPIVFDTTNNKLWVYNGAWKSVTLV